MLVTNLEFQPITGEFAVSVRGVVQDRAEHEVCSSLVQNLGGQISLRQLLAILDELEERTNPLVCNWCSDLGEPDPRCHPNGTPEHIPLESSVSPQRVLVTVQTQGAPNVAQQVVIERGVRRQVVVEHAVMVGGHVVPLHMPMTIVAQVLS